MHEYKAKVLRVLDGDTIEVDIYLGFNITLSNQKVRFEGIDTPEFRTTDIEEKKLGLISKNKIQEKLSINSDIIIQTKKFDNSYDKFGRILATIILNDGLNLNKWLIDNNYAVQYNGENKETLKNTHQKNKKILIDRGELN
jgi:micrococcal nuclease